MCLIWWSAVRGPCRDQCLIRFFLHFTSDFRYNTTSCHLQKFLDDTAVVGCVSEGDDQEYRGLLLIFSIGVHFCINTSKTKEMLIDFRRKASMITSMTIQDLDIERVTTYKYLGVHLNNTLD